MQRRLEEIAAAKAQLQQRTAAVKAQADQARSAQNAQLDQFLIAQKAQTDQQANLIKAQQDRVKMERQAAAAQFQAQQQQAKAQAKDPGPGANGEPVLDAPLQDSALSSPSPSNMTLSLGQMPAIESRLGNAMATVGGPGGPQPGPPQQPQAAPPVAPQAAIAPQPQGQGGGGQVSMPVGPGGPPDEQAAPFLTSMQVVNGSRQTPYGTEPTRESRLTMEPNVLTAAQAAQLRMNREEMNQRNAQWAAQRKQQVFLAYQNEFKDPAIAAKLADFGDDYVGQAAFLKNLPPTFSARIQDMKLAEYDANMRAFNDEHDLKVKQIVGEGLNNDLTKARLDALADARKAAQINPEIPYTTAIGLRPRPAPIRTLNADGTASWKDAPMPTREQLETRLRLGVDSKGNILPATGGFFDGLAMDMADVNRELLIVSPAKEGGFLSSFGFGDPGHGQRFDRIPIAESVRLFETAMGQGTPGEIAAARERLAPLVDWEHSKGGEVVFRDDDQTTEFNRASSKIFMATIMGGVFESENPDPLAADVPPGDRGTAENDPALAAEGAGEPNVGVVRRFGRFVGGAGDELAQGFQGTAAERLNAADQANRAKRDAITRGNAQFIDSVVRIPGRVAGAVEGVGREFAQGVREGSGFADDYVPTVQEWVDQGVSPIDAIKFRDAKTTFGTWTRGQRD